MNAQDEPEQDFLWEPRDISDKNQGMAIAASDNVVPIRRAK
jgi:hypothetical protein